MRVKISPMAAVFFGGMMLVSALPLLAREGGLGDLRAGITEALTVVWAALLHELGHIAAAWGWRVPVRSLRLDLFGARMELGGLMGYSAELAVAAGGPFVSLAVAAVAWPLGALWEGASLLAAVSLGLGLLNLLPVRGLDGGRMLTCALSLLFGERAADTTLRLTTGLALGVLWLLSVYALLRVGQTLSLFTFTLCLLFRLLGK